MTRDEAMTMLKDESDRAEVLSDLFGEERIALLIQPDTGRSCHRPKMLIDRWIAAGWELVSEFENGKQVEVHQFHLRLK